jgi:hypothetical protein
MMYVPSKVAQVLRSNSAFSPTIGLFGWLVADGWCWSLLREEYCWLVAGDWFVLRGKYCWLVADKPSEQAAYKELCIFAQLQAHLLGEIYGKKFLEPKTNYIRRIKHRRTTKLIIRMNKLSIINMSLKIVYYGT